MKLTKTWTIQLGIEVALFTIRKYEGGGADIMVVRDFMQSGVAGDLGRFNWLAY
jgi:hypothetical protein